MTDPIDALLGGILHDPTLALDAIEVVQSQHMPDWRSAQIFEAIERVLGEGMDPTPARVNAELRSMRAEPFDDAEARRIAVPFTRKTVLSAAEHIAEQGRRRLLTATTKQLLDALTGGSDIPTAEHAERICSSVVEIMTRGAVKHHDVVDLAQAAFEQAQARARGEMEVERYGIGIPHIDQHIRVIPKYTKIAFAPSGGGKTTWALWYSERFVQANAKMGAVFMSLADMDAAAIGGRSLASYSGVSSTFTLFDAPTTEHQRNMADGLVQMSRHLRGRHKVIEPGELIEQCVMHARRAHLAMARRGIRLGLVVIDYAQRAEVRERGLADFLVLRKVSKACLKEIARPLNCEVLITSQMNRDQSKRSTGKRKQSPKTSDIAGGSDLERDAHCVLAITDEGFPKRDLLDAHGKKIMPRPADVERIRLQRFHILKNRFMPNHNNFDMHGDLAANRYFVPGDQRCPVSRWVNSRSQPTLPTTSPASPNGWGQP